ncbi:M12 family metallo-peptidase [Thalassotalea nanhaiensis]|uniref:M12 family metallo-peptidase n=1 Tax=Thalassotalea nanhaiensis TaxID=3065648 RepID=A0ABY9TDU6_9GAMM|nr:M12 family metallo-peptidase [Colwelliaceae bacterium SQ345]
MKKILVSIAALLTTVITTARAQTPVSAPIWSDVDNNISQLQYRNSEVTDKSNMKAKVFRNLSADFHLLNQQMQQSKLSVEVPLPNGETVLFDLNENAVLPKALAKKYPSIRTFTGVQKNNPAHTGRFDITPQGFHGLFNYQGKTVFIDPQFKNDQFQYASYYKSDAQSLTVQATDIATKVKSVNKLLSAKSASGLPINKTYRIAFATTGEYSEFHGGTKELVLAALATLTNRMNEVFQRDLAISLQLIAESEAVIFLDANSDPFANNDNDVYQNAVVLQQYVGNDKFDIGHLVTTGAGGLAGVGVACDNDLVDEGDINSGVWKALGVTGSPAPSNDSFYIDFVAHELGHQFGAEHSFNALSGACSGNRWQSSAFEPGSGSTIMAYTGICGEANLQSNSDDYFHIESIKEMTEYLTNDPWGIGQSCGVTFDNGNTAPEVDAGIDYQIPANSPFRLTATATDKNSDELTYTWEQVDLGEASFDLETMVDDSSRPIFRSFKPTSIPYRVFPQLESILSGELMVGENYPTTTRQLNFKVTARDNRGGVSWDQMMISVNAEAGPFIITQPIAGEFWKNEVESKLQWDVANTDLAPINCKTVDISFSSDGGDNFDLILAQNTENDGEQLISTPVVDTTTARLKISCNDNIFFTISDEFQVLTPPIANDDAFTVEFESRNNTFDVLDNDTDLNPDDSLFITSVSYDGQGTVAIVNNTLVYSAPNNYDGIDRVHYQVADASGYQASAQVIITIKPKTKSKSSGGSLFSLNALALLWLIRRKHKIKRKFYIV